MNLNFTKNKKLMFDTQHNLVYDGSPTKEQYKELSNFLLEDENKQKSVIFVHMGSISGDIITILKGITEQCERMNKYNVYICEDSTPNNFWYCII